MLTIGNNKIQYYRRKPGAFSIDDYTKYSPGCVLHLKADAGVTIDADGTPAGEGDMVRKWDSQALMYTDFAFQQTESLRPIYHTNSLNSLPMVSFTKETYQRMVMQSRAKFDIYTPSIFLVGRMNSGSGFCGKGGNYPDTLMHRKLQIGTTGDGALVVYKAGTDAMSGCTAYATTTDWNIYSVISHRNNLTNLNVNGVDNWQTAVIDNSSFNTANFVLGCGFDLTTVEGGSCDIAEIIILNYSAPDFVKQQIINYLSVKWGISVTNTVPAEIPTRGAYVERAGF